ncbi:MAG: hypothetical protein WKF75_13625 [Singulisphaera sp.]
MRLDGAQSVESIRDDFEAEFGDPLSVDDFDDFLEVAREQDDRSSRGLRRRTGRA